MKPITISTNLVIVNHRPKIYDASIDFPSAPINSPEYIPERYSFVWKIIFKNKPFHVYVWQWDGREQEQYNPIGKTEVVLIDQSLITYNR